MTLFLGRNAQFRALLKPPQTLYGPQRSQKQLKYIPVLSRYLKETFECIRNMDSLMGIQNSPSSGKSGKNAQFLALLKPYRPRMDLKESKNSWNIWQTLIGTSGKHLNALDTWWPKWGPKTAQVAKTAKMLNSKPLLKPLQTLYGSQRCQKEWKYIPVPG